MALKITWHPIPLQPLFEIQKTIWAILKRQKQVYMGKLYSSTLVLFIQEGTQNFQGSTWRNEQASPNRAVELAQSTVTKNWNDGGMKYAKKQQRTPALLHTETVSLGGQTRHPWLPKKYYSAANAMWNYLIYWL